MEGERHLLDVEAGALAGRAAGDGIEAEVKRPPEPRELAQADLQAADPRGTFAGSMLGDQLDQALGDGKLMHGRPAASPVSQAKPVRHAFAAARRELQGLDGRIDLPGVGETAGDVEVDVRQEVDLGHDQEIRRGEEVGILARLVVALGHRQ